MSKESIFNAVAGFMRGQKIGDKGLSFFTGKFAASENPTRRNFRGNRNLRHTLHKFIFGGTVYMAGAKKV